MEDKLVQVLEYRGYSVPIYMDDPGQQFYCKLDGEEIGFGSFNTNYEDDLHYIIDQKLDTISYFEDFPGAKLEWFFNGYNDRDIRLVSRSRMIEVFLVDDPTKVDIEKLKVKCVELLTNYRAYINKKETK